MELANRTAGKSTSACCPGLCRFMLATVKGIPILQFDATASFLRGSLVRLQSETETVLNDMHDACKSKRLSSRISKPGLNGY